MKFLGLLILVLFGLFPTVPVLAQDTTSGSFVTSLIARDHPTLCDEIGKAVLPAEINNNTVNREIQQACDYSVIGAELLAMCIEPYPHLGNGQASDPPDGQIYIFCRVFVRKFGSVAVTVDPTHFFVSGNEAARNEVNPLVTQQIPEERRLQRTELATEGSYVHGILAFQAPAEISRPFALVWWPDTAPDESALGIVIDRTVPWEEAATL
jgi:hypothetical protein